MIQNTTVVCFGELLMRLDAPGHQRFLQADQFGVSFTGGEANVAVALQQWGIPARVVSRVPAHELGTACLNSLRNYGVDIRFVLRGGDRLGLLFVETGASQRNSKVIYDRLHTSFRGVTPDEFDWPAILEGATWFHFTGTAPALGESVRRTLKNGIVAAKSLGIRVSFDSSYRSALWTIEQATPVFRELLEMADVFFGSESDAQQFFGIEADGTDTLSLLCERYRLQHAAFTSRSVKPNGLNTCGALLGTASECAESRLHEINVVDRIGAGDAFAAAVIRGLTLNTPLQQIVEEAICAAVLKHSIPGDFALLAWEEVQQLAATSGGEHSGRGWR